MDFPIGHVTPPSLLRTVGAIVFRAPWERGPYLRRTQWVLPLSASLGKKVELYILALSVIYDWGRTIH